MGGFAHHRVFYGWVPLKTVILSETKDLNPQGKQQQKILRIRSE
jgi:hypothetical protein